jgi:hypothetical protein
MRLIDNAIRSAILPPDTLGGHGATVLLRRLADQRMYEAKRQIPLNF